jgi:hypothetical protein
MHRLLDFIEAIILGFFKLFAWILILGTILIIAGAL